MEALIEFGKLLIPAGLVLYAMYLTVRSFLNKELERKVIDIKMKNADAVLPIRLQAYERMSLFLERINPSNLVPRVNAANYSARELHQKLLREIRDEYNHNLSQQVYMSDAAWNLVKNSMEEVVMIINDAASGLTDDAKGLELARIIMEKTIDRKMDPVEYPLKQIKDEIRELF